MHLRSKGYFIITVARMKYLAFKHMKYNSHNDHPKFLLVFSFIAIINWLIWINQLIRSSFNCFELIVVVDVNSLVLWIIKIDLDML